MEPTHGQMRPIHVRSRCGAAVVVVACVLPLAGCGSSSPSPSVRREQTASSGSCAGDSVSYARARPVGSVDLDGDGRADQVRLTTGSRECPARLVAHPAGAYVGGELTGADPAPVTVLGVHLRGHAGDLLVTRQDHPRGGYQLHLFTVDDGALVELEAGGRPLVPFVATDTRPIPYAVDCASGAIVLRQATAKGEGTWDVTRTAYRVDDRGAPEQLSRAVTPRLTTQQADRLMPAGEPFASCPA